MDLASIVGLSLGIAAILVGNFLEGGKLHAIVQPTAALIVLGGTLGATILSYSLKDLVRSLRMGLSIFFPARMSPEALTQDILTLAQLVRKEGILGLEQRLPTIKQPLLHTGLRYAVDGMEPALTRELLETDLAVQEEMEEVGAKVFETAGGYAPTIGILGAVLGLIHTMENLNDPSGVGGGIAVAFVATVYGVGSANLLFLPAASKVKRGLAQTRLCKEIIIQGVMAIQEGLNPRLIEDKLRIYVGEEAAEQKAREK